MKSEKQVTRRRSLESLLYPEKEKPHVGIPKATQQYAQDLHLGGGCTIESEDVLNLLLPDIDTGYLNAEFELRRAENEEIE